MKIFTVTGQPSDDVVASIVRLLRSGKVVVLPTDTIYGLHCDARSEAAVEQIFAMKERERGKPLVVLASSIDQAENLGVVLRDDVRDVLNAAWPAPLTAVLPLRHPIAASAGAHSLALRIPAITWLRELIAKSGPLVSTSVNVSGEKPVARFEQIPDEIRNHADAGIDCGPLEGLPSTLIDLVGSEPRLLREGAAEFSQNLWKSLRKSL